MKGRNQTLIQRRDRALAARYYYWTELQRRRYDDVTYILTHHEFFVGMQTIREVLHSQNDYINELIAKRITAKTLHEKYPAFNWNKTPIIAGK